MQTVRDVMSNPVVVVVETLTLPEARNILKERNIRRVPVVNNAGFLVGIVTEGDINQISASHQTDVREYNLYYRAANLPLNEIMTKPVLVATPSMRLIEAAQLMMEHKIGGLPVVEDQRVVGMITESDLFREMINLLIAAEQSPR